MSDGIAHEFRRAVDDFWMRPCDLRMLDVLRRSYGLLLFLNVALLWLDRRIFFGIGSWLPEEAAREVVDQDTWSLYSFVSGSPFAIDLALLTLMAAAVSLLTGIYPRLAAAVSFFFLIAVHHANIMLFDAEDAVFRLFAFYLIFAPPWCQLQPVDQGLSPGGKVQTGFPAWPLRLFQLQMCLIYLCSAIQKTDGAEWLDGTALYFVLRLDDATRYPLPSTISESMAWIRILTWSVLAFELFLPLLIWWQRTRWLCLVTAFLFHIVTNFSMNLHLFHWIMIVGLLSFVRYDEWCAACRLLRFHRPSKTPPFNNTRG